MMRLACRIAGMNPEPENSATTWAWRVTDAEIHAAKRDWLRARDRGAAEQDVAWLFEYFRILLSAQAQQIAEEFRARRSA